MSEITILMPVYKHRAYLNDAVESVLNQTFEDWRLLIFNDDPKASLSSFENIDKRIEVYSTSEHKGKSWHLNNGIKMSESKYIVFQDADDYMTKYRLEASVCFIGESDLLYGDSIFIDGKYKTYRSSREPTDPISALKKKNFAIFSTVMVKTDIAKQVRFDEKVKYGNDYVWYIDLFKKFPDLKIKHINLPLIYQRHYTSTYRLYQNIPIIRKLYRLKIARERRKIVEERYKT